MNDHNVQIGDLKENTPPFLSSSIFEISMLTSAGTLKTLSAASYNRFRENYMKKIQKLFRLHVLANFIVSLEKIVRFRKKFLKLS